MHAKRVGTVVLNLNHVPAPCCHDDPSLDRKDKPGNDGGKTPKRSIDEKEVCFLFSFNVSTSGSSSTSHCCCCPRCCHRSCCHAVLDVASARYCCHVVLI